jgi:LPS-assembly protein
MPAFMMRSSPFWSGIVVLGSIMPEARAADPPCPSQIARSLAAAIPAPTVAGAAAASAAGPAAADKGNIDLTADEGTFDVVNGNAILKGNVQARQGDRQIHANEVEYNSASGSLRTDGHIDYLDPLVHVTGTGGSYSAATGADFKAADFSLRGGAARGAAQEMSLTPDGVMRLQGVTFTTCPLHDKSWQLKAGSIVLDTRDQIGTGRNTQVDFMGVPLMYLPWVSFPLSSERKSGFLFPGIGNTSTNGVQLSVPYYWNIAPQADFTFQPILYSKAGADLGGDFRELTENQSGELDWNYLPDDAQYGGSRSRVRLHDVAELSDDWRLTVNAANVSDPFYFEDFSNGPEGASTAFLDRSATFSYRSENWIVDGQAQQYQTIDYTLLQADRPYARVPGIAAAADYTLGAAGLLHYGFDSEVVDFQHSQQPDTVTTGWRTDVHPQVWLDLTGPGYFVRPAVGWRATQYELDTLGPGQLVRSPSRTLPILSFDSGLQFERFSGSHDQRKLTLEPRIKYLYVPYRNQNDLPVFDTALPDLAPIMLFRDNRYVGADRVSDANQVSFGVTSRLLDASNGRQFISGTFGQTYYFETPRVTLPGEPPVTGKRSDIVAQIALTAFQDWSADVNVQWDPESEASERTTVNLQYKPAVNTVVNFAYRYERFVNALEVIEGYPQVVQQGFDQLELSSAWPIKRNWSIFLKDVYSLRNQQPPPPSTPVAESTELERFVGFEYRACCWRLRLGARRYVTNHDGSQNTGIWLSLELAGLASVGSASDTSLTEEIRGYTPPQTTTIKTQGPLRSIW